MFLKKLDMISPPVTLFFKGSDNHSSIFAAILTILTYAIVFALAIYYFLGFINKTNPTAFFFDRFIEDSGVFPLNASSIFHYIGLKDIRIEGSYSIDFDKVRIVGFKNIIIDSYYTTTDLETIPHWIYGPCNNSTDTENIGYLMTSEIFNCACVRQYYNPEKKKYISTTDADFVHPTIEHGMSNPEFKGTYYGITIEKCKDDNLRKLSGLGSCKSDEEINDYIYSCAITLYIVDHYSDVTNYLKPYNNYIYSISNLLAPKIFTVNNLNFNPSTIKTHNGIFFDNVVEEKSFIFIQNEKNTMDEEIEITDKEGNPIYDEKGNILKKSTGIAHSFYFWMQNRLQFYERNYERFQDILGDIGGIREIIYLIASIINALYSYYTILSDTEEIFFTINNNNEIDKTISNNKDKINEILNPPKIQRHYINNNINLVSNAQKLMKYDIDIYGYSLDNKKKYNNLFESMNNDKNYEEKIKKEEENLGINRKGIRKRKSLKIKRKESHDSNKLIDEQKKKNKINQIINKNLSLCKFIKYLFYCKKKDENISFIEIYREKIVSEESMIQGYLDILQMSSFYKKKDSNDNINKENLNVNYDNNILWQSNNG